MTAGDRLLFAISAKRELGWPSFKKMFEQICAESLAEDELRDANLARYETARGLDALGHLDLDFTSPARLYVAPPAMALLPVSGLPVAVLAGARSPRTLQELSARILRRGTSLVLAATNQPQEPRSFPARIAVLAETRGDLRSLAVESGLAFQEEPASWRILNFAGSLSEYMTGIKWQRGDALNWERQQFDVQGLRFLKTPSGSETGLIRYVHPSRQYPLYVLWSGADAAHVDPDWGRFAILKAAGRDVVFYERSTGAFIVPVTIPLPRLFARAMCLSSGLAPRILPASAVSVPLDAPQYRVYTNVPLDHAHMAARKLDQRLNTDVSFRGEDND